MAPTPHDDPVEDAGSPSPPIRYLSVQVEGYPTQVPSGGIAGLIYGDPGSHGREDAFHNRLLGGVL